MSQPEGQIVRVLCVDDNALIVQALNHRLAMEPWLHVVDVLQRADHLAEAAVATSADIVLLDLDMPGRDAFDALEKLVLWRPETRCIMLSGYARTDLLDRAASVGAWGYVTKHAGAEAVVAAIRGVCDGQFVISPDVQGP